MAATIYLLCTLTSLACAILLLGSFRRTRFRLLLWSGAAFVGFTLNNLLLLLDKTVFTDIDLLTWRLGSALVSLSLLLYGLIDEKD